jgi:muramoyltetrapeptide carboxypeptidase
MIQPPFLKQGDTVAIVSPARKADRELITAAVTILESWGLTVQTGSHLFTDDHSYLAASDDKRVKDFQRAIDDASVRAIICARGGYGTTRILNALDFSTFTKTPKWVTGFSDITALHLALHKQGFQSIHSTVPVLFNRNGAAVSVESLKHTLFGTLSPLSAPPSPANKEGQATGTLVGGNLSLIVDSLGTQTEIETTNGILVIEDVGEHFYKIDRMMVQLKRAGKLAALSGLVAGYFTDITESALPFGETVEAIIRHHTREYAYPVAFKFSIGHEEPNTAWICGALAQLSVSDSGSQLRYTTV